LGTETPGAADVGAETIAINPQPSPAAAAGG